MRALTRAARPLLLAVLVGPACSRSDPSATATATATTTATALEAAVDAAIAGQRGLHGIVALGRSGDVVVLRALGDERSAGPDTRFAIGSVTKPLTAACVLALVDRGALALGASARAYVPELPAGISIEHLLAHTSGLASYTDAPDLRRARGARHDAAEILARILAAKPGFAPGSRFSYSNSNYFALGLVVEKVTGRPYQDALRTLVLAPAGMTRTTLSAAPDGDEARGHTPLDGGARAPAPAVDPSFSYAALGLRSTARDLFAFDRALGGDLLATSTRARMAAPGPGGYGLGWDVRREAGHDVLSHEGGIDGFSAYFARLPDLGLAVAVLLSTDAFEAGQPSAPAIGEGLVKRLTTLSGVNGDKR